MFPRVRAAIPATICIATPNNQQQPTTTVQITVGSSSFKSDAAKDPGEQHHLDAEREEDDRDIRTVGCRNHLRNRFQFRHITFDAGHRHCELDGCPKR
jgi:hypothetical protein